MCGIVGVIAKKETKNISYKEKEMFIDMLFADALRGLDSTGLFVVNKWGNVDWAKEASVSADFLENKEADKILNKYYSAMAMVGHNRKATIGKVSDETAHPFIEDDFILVHNGTLTNHKELNDKVDVDSHALCHAIASDGIDKALDKVKGAYAIACYDTKNKKLFLARNKERPLWICESEDMFAFASEPWLLYGMAWRNEIKLTKQPVPTQENLIYEFNIGSEVTCKTRAIEKPKPLFVVPKPKLLPKNKDISSNFLKVFFKDSCISFEPKTMSLNDGVRWIKGKHQAFPNVEICAYFKNDIPASKIRDLFSNPLLNAIVENVNYDGNRNTGRVWVKDVTTVTDIITRNGTIIPNEELDVMPAHCTQCGDFISYADLSQTFVKRNHKKQPYYIVCPNCIKQNLKTNHRWGNLEASPV